MLHFIPSIIIFVIWFHHSLLAFPRRFELGRFLLLAIGVHPGKKVMHPTSFDYRIIRKKIEIPIVSCFNV